MSRFGWKSFMCYAYVHVHVHCMCYALCVCACALYLFLELGDEPPDELVVEVLTAEERVAVGRLDLEHALLDLEHRDIERAAAQVVHRDAAMREPSTHILYSISTVQSPLPLYSTCTVQVH